MAAAETFARNIVESGQRAAARSDSSAGTETRRATFRVWRGTAAGGQLQDYATSVSEGMVVLDAIHQIQAESAGDLAVRWNCKAGKCGSCSAEINGMPRLMCMTPPERARSGRAGHGRANEGVSSPEGSGDGRVVEFPRQETDQEIHSEGAGRARRNLAHGAGRCRPRSGVQEVHRVLSVPGRVPRSPQPPAS